MFLFLVEVLNGFESVISTDFELLPIFKCLRTKNGLMGTLHSYLELSVLFSIFFVNGSINVFEAIYSN